MNKHYSLSDFVMLLKLHRTLIDRMVQSKSSISHHNLLHLLISSKEAKAAELTYVIGSMQGSQDDQYDAMLTGLRKAGKQSLVSILEKRRNLPCIDIQECIWLVNSSSDRD